MSKESVLPKIQLESEGVLKSFVRKKKFPELQLHIQGRSKVTEISGKVRLEGPEDDSYNPGFGFVTAC